jgi:hypothetical protein
VASTSQNAKPNADTSGQTAGSNDPYANKPWKRPLLPEHLQPVLPNPDVRGADVKAGVRAEKDTRPTQQRPLHPQQPQPLMPIPNVRREDVKAGARPEKDTCPPYQKAIDALTPKSLTKDTNAAATLILKAELDSWSYEQAFDGMVEKLNTKKATVTKIIREAKAAIESAKAAIESAKPKSSIKRDPQGRVIFSFEGEPDFYTGVSYCVAALKEKNGKDRQPTFCRISANPLRLRVDKETGRVTFETMTYAGLWSALNNIVTYVQSKEHGDGPRQPVPHDVAKHIFEQAECTMPLAPQAIYTPIFKKSGFMIETPGFHFRENPPLNHFYYQGDLVIPSIHKTITKDHVDESLRWLTVELLSDFPFLDHDLDGVERRGPGEANALAMLTTPFMREMIPGRTPLFFVTKPTPGTGGTLLASLPILLSDGSKEGVSHINYTDSEAEMGKLLVTRMMKGDSYFFFDDVEEFNNRYIIRSLTGDVVTGRELQTSRDVSRPNKFGWYAAGNNSDVGDEMERRTCWLRLNAKTSNVRNRQFRHQKKWNEATKRVEGETLTDFVMKNRGLAIHHILTLIAYWIQEGAVEFTDRGLLGFDEWAAKVGGVLQVCGVKDFLNTAKPVALDMGSSADIELQRTWMDKKGAGKRFTAKELFEFAAIENLSILKGRSDDERRVNFDKSLRRIRGRVFMFVNKEYEVLAENGAKGVVFWIAALGEAANGS